jgi:hypothetical protein
MWNCARTSEFFSRRGKVAFVMISLPHPASNCPIDIRNTATFNDLDLCDISSNNTNLEDDIHRLLRVRLEDPNSLILFAGKLWNSFFLISDGCSLSLRTLKEYQA